MPISVTCPHCQTRYPAIPDNLAGKMVRCKKPECRQQFAVPAAGATGPAAPPAGPSAPPAAGPKPAPKPAAGPAVKAAPGPQPKPANGKPGSNGSGRPTVPISSADTPPPSPPVDADAAALAALADEPAQKEDAGDRTIPLKCAVCEHEWTVPFAMAGKNALCPECRHRVKVPEPKEDTPQDWRQQRSKLPSLAKQNYEKPTDVQDAGDAKTVGGDALRKAGVIGDEIEPRTLKQKAQIALLILTPIVLVAVGVWYLTKTRTVAKETNMFADSLKEWEEATDKPTGGEAAMFSAVLHMAAAEHALRQNETLKDEKRLKDALDHFGKAREELTHIPANQPPANPPASARNALVGELAVAITALGGSDEQVKEFVRYRWRPNLPTGRALRPNEKSSDVHTELGRTLKLLLGADYDLRAGVLRRLTRELAKRGQPDLAADLPGMFFAEPELPEARSIAALELYRADKNSPLARQIAEELKLLLSGGAGGRNPAPVSAQILWKTLGIEKAPTLWANPPPGGTVDDNSGLAAVGTLLLQDKPEDALKVAERVARPEGRLRAVALCAEWAPDPTAALDAAGSLVRNEGKKKDVTLPPGTLFRLTQLAAAAKSPDKAQGFADAIPDDGLKAWAKGDAVRYRVGPGLKEPADETWVEVPDDTRKMRAGHAWGRLWVARHNAMLSGSDDVKKYASWPKGSIQPFGRAGVALGIQDRQ